VFGGIKGIPLKPLIQLLLLLVCLAPGSASAQTLVSVTVINDKFVPQSVFEPNLRGVPPFSGVGLTYQINNQPANPVLQFRYWRPDGSIAFDSGAFTQTSAFSANSTTSYYWFVWLNVTGTWHITLDLNGAPFANASFTVGGGYTISTVVGDGSVGDGEPAPAAILTTPLAVAADSAGNLYIADFGDSRVRKIAPSGAISTIAGTGSAGFNGDGIRATSAELNGPSGVAVDSAGAVYISDSGNNRVRKIGSDGIISTVAGSLPDSLSSPQGLALDGMGNLYIADRFHHRIQMLTRDGTISTVAGTGTQGFNGDGQATKSQLSLPFGLCLDSQSNLYIADSGNNSVRRLSAAGILSTVAGTGQRGYGGDGRLATSADMSAPVGVAVDGAGDLYISDHFNDVIRKVSPKGVIGKFAGMFMPWGLTVDTSGNLYVAAGFTSIYKVTSAGTSTIISGGINFPSHDSDGIPATSTHLRVPQGVAIDQVGNLYIADSNNNQVRKVTRDGTASIFAGFGIAGYTGDGVDATRTDLAHPSAVAFDAAGNLYISDSYSNLIRQVDKGGTISTIGGKLGSGFGGDGGYATAANLNFPFGLAVARDGSLYIADQGNHCMRKITHGIITTVAGTQSPGYNGDGISAVSAKLQFPSDVAIDSGGNLYIADYSNSRIRKVSTGGVITTIAGTGVAGSVGDGGPAVNAQLLGPERLAVDGQGNLYIASRDNRIRKITTDGIISTIAGTGNLDFGGDGGPAAVAQLSRPAGLAVDGTGAVYIADSTNDRIRKLTPVQISAAGIVSAASLLPGPIAPGEILSINGTNIGPANLAGFQLDASGLVTTTLADTRVLFNGIPAALLSVQANQVTAVVPYALDGKSSTQLQIEYKGVKTNPVTLRVSPSAPSIFTANSVGTGQGAILNEDSSPNSPANPAQIGSVITIYATGTGQTDPPRIDGAIATTDSSKPLLPVTAKIGGIPAEVIAVGTVPNEVTGKIQVKVRIPAGVVPGDGVPTV
jgi:uncharacterized protein (TIGR03437 family)